MKKVYIKIIKLNFKTLKTVFYSKINCRLVYNGFMGETIVMVWEITNNGHMPHSSC